MPIVNIELTQEEIMSGNEPAPFGTYTLRLEAFKKDPARANEKDGGVILKSKSGNPKVSVRFAIKSDDMNQDGKSIWYDAVIAKGRKGFTFAALLQAFPNLMQGKDMNTDAVIGQECKADVVIETYKGKPRNKIAALKHLFS